MSDLRTREVTDLLGITPATLRLWTERFGFPTMTRGDDRRLRFDAEEIDALKRALEISHSVTMAIGEARGGRARLVIAA